MKSNIEYLFILCLAAVVNSQASELQCVGQICCTKSNQDVSESCWSQCSSYQQQLAEIGCHILPPSTKSSTPAPAMPSLTTSWGPGQYCVAFGPGEGSGSCFTIPGGCYIVPSIDNVVPQVVCTATATSSSGVVSITHSNMQITSSSAASSSRVHSSSSVLPSSTNGVSITPSSSVTPSSSSAASSTTSLTSASQATSSLPASSSVSTPSTITTPSSVIPSLSLASSSAVQSSGLPVIVGGVVSSAASATSAAQAFSQNPTTDTKNALEKAVSAAQDATTAAKALADAAAFTALSAELATVLSSLAEAAATLASAEALADIAAAVAPEIAAAAAAAVIAKALEVAGPQPTGQQPSGNQPSATKQSMTQQSPSSAAGSSVAPSSASITSGSITSASASSMMTSSATASASTCAACVACADASMSAIPTPDPVDPFPDSGDSITDNSTLTRSRKRFHNADFVEIDARTATRDVTICKMAFPAPSYNSYSGAGNGNSYSPYYSYSFTIPRCSTYDWDLTQGPTAPDTGTYATEHIYELQLIGIFLRWLRDNNGNLKAYLKVNNRQICKNFIGPMLFGTGSQWTVTTFGAGGNIKTSGSRPVDELLSQLSGGSAHSDELVYLNSHLNGLKAKLIGGSTLSGMTVPDAQLALVAETSALYLYLRDPHVSTIFKAVSTRIKAFYAKLDRACAGSNRGPCAARVAWEDEYQTWQAEHLAGIDGDWQRWKTGQVTSARATIQPKTRGSAMWTAFLAAVNAQEATGKLSPGNYSFAAEWTI